MDNFTTTTATATQNKPLTLVDLEAAIKLLSSIGPEPFGEYMRKQGFDPKDGYRLALPASMREQCGPLVPSYVGFTTAADAPIIYLDPTQWLRNSSSTRDVHK
jgi:hypothetical protein